MAARQEDKDRIKQENFKRDVAASYFRGSKRAFGASLPDGHFAGKPYTEAGRGWCPHLQWCYDNSDFEWEYIYRFRRNGLQVQLVAYDKETGEVVHEFPAEWVTSRVQNGADLERVGLLSTIELMKMVDERYRKV